MQPPSIRRALAALFAPPCLLPILAAFFIAIFGVEAALANAVAEGDKGYIQEITGVNILPFVYLGAKHMVTGYDHILFLLAVVFGTQTAALTRLGDFSTVEALLIKLFLVMGSYVLGGLFLLKLQKA